MKHKSQSLITDTLTKTVRGITGTVICIGLQSRENCPQRKPSTFEKGSDLGTTGEIGIDYVVRSVLSVKASLQVQLRMDSATVPKENFKIKIENRHNFYFWFDIVKEGAKE